MMLRMNLIPLLVAAFAAGARAQVLTVGPAGSGAQFSNLHAAVAAAPPGGTVVVAAGTYQEPGVLSIDKPLTLLGAGPASTRFVCASVPVGEPAIRVTGLAAGASVRVVGLGIEQGLFWATAAAVEVRDCTGSVELAELDCAPDGRAYGSGAPVVEVKDSVVVTMVRCTIEPGTVASAATSAALSIENALVHLDACTLTGATELPSLGVAAAYGGAPAVVLDGDAIVRISGSQVRGGRGAASTLQAGPATPGAAAVRVISGSVLVRGGAGCVLEGGAGAPFFGMSAGAAAIDLSAGALGVVTPDVTLQAGADSDGVVRTANVTGAGALLALAQPLATITATASQVPGGGSASFDLHGEGSALCLPLFDTALGAPFSLPGVLGQFSLAFSPALSLPVAALDANGVGAFAVTIPSNPVLVGVTGYVQSLAFAPSGLVSVSSPTFFVVR